MPFGFLMYPQTRLLYKTFLLDFYLVMPDRLLLQIRGLTKSYGTKELFKDASLNVTENQKIGVIGRNGAGKTTLFKMILKEIEQDYGEILEMPILRLGYIEQHDPFLPDETVLEFLERYTKKPSWECSKIASQFELKNELLETKVLALSGGYQMRVKLTATLLFDPNLLLLDEPTNFLDLSTLILLEQFLKGFRGTFMVITHDREFIKKTCLQTLDVSHGQLFLHPEPLEDYLEFKAEQEELAKSVNVNIERKQKQLQTFVDRFGAKASMAKSAQSKMKQIDKLDDKKIGIKNAYSTVKMFIPPVERKLGAALEVKNLDIGYPNKVVAKNISFSVERGQKVAILGNNGEGKSTLLKTIKGDLKPINGSCEMKPSLKVAYYNQLVSQALDPKQTIKDYILSTTNNKKEEEIYRVLGNFLFKREDYLKQIAVLSGGEKARLCMASMFLSGSDVYLLDEPTNHLDFETVESMGEALGNFNGTVFVVSHDRTFVSLIATEIIEVKKGNVKRVLGTYEDYVWQLEQIAENNFGMKKATETDSKYSEEVVAADMVKLAKVNRIKTYELQKELSKIQKKIQALIELVNANEDVETNQAKIDDLEITWLEKTEELAKLKV